MNECRATASTLPPGSDTWLARRSLEPPAVVPPASDPRRDPTIRTPPPASDGRRPVRLAPPPPPGLYGAPTPPLLLRTSRMPPAASGSTREGPPGESPDKSDSRGSRAGDPGSNPTTGVEPGIEPRLLVRSALCGRDTGGTLPPACVPNAAADAAPAPASWLVGVRSFRLETGLDRMARVCCSRAAAVSCTGLPDGLEVGGGEGGVAPRFDDRRTGSGPGSVRWCCGEGGACPGGFAAGSAPAPEDFLLGRDTTASVTMAPGRPRLWAASDVRRCRVEAGC